MATYLMQGFGLDFVLDFVFFSELIVKIYTKGCSRTVDAFFVNIPF